MSASSPASPQQPDHPEANDDAVDLLALVGRIRRALYQIVGLALVGAGIAGIGSFASARLQPTTTATHVYFSYPGFERGEYPDKSKFQADDLRAPAVIAEALRRQQLDTSNAFQGLVRGGLSIEGIIPPTIAKERDRLRASGQTPPVYIPDEYALTLSLRGALSVQQRENFLREIVSVYVENFRRDFGKAPLAFGSAFETLRTADFAEFELILNADLDSIRNYLVEEQLIAKSYRSPNTGFTFKDLAGQTEMFAQIHLTEVLGLIHENGLSRNRRTAMLKMDYYLRQLSEREQHALEDEKVVRDLLNQTQSRGQNYVLGIKSQAAQPRSEAPLLDQNLIDSLLVNDSYNFLVHRALESGARVKEIQAEKNRLISLRDNMKSFVESPANDQTAVAAQVDASLKSLQANYEKLITAIRRTHEDFAAQQFAGALRFSDQFTTSSLPRAVALAAALGAIAGAFLGIGCGILGIYVGRPLDAAP